ncbi:hypothetical protein [Nocardia brasiliensis]|uniref:hypothetical protein n=1 Tax=Nocardia brasiliensis TaxID=37326 RepID=UPI0024583034|nr:hypothetical protein [Nocardia brasiliensis]
MSSTAQRTTRGSAGPGRSTAHRDMPPAARVEGPGLLFERTGIQMPIQVLWIVPHTIDPTQLAALADRIATGALGVRWTPARVPLARPVWTSSRLQPEISIGAEIAAGDQCRWADHEIATAQLDLRAGRGWRLAMAPVADGSSVVSLVVSHSITDGQGVIVAVDAATRGEPTPATTSRPGVLDDLCDAVSAGAREYLAIATATATQFGTLHRPAAVLGNALRVLTHGTVVPERPIPANIIFTLPTGDLTDLADTHAGTSTGLSVAIVANVVRALTATRHGTTTVAVPVSHRIDGDPSAANLITTGVVDLGEHTGRYTDLADIRRRSKLGYQGATGKITGWRGAHSVLSSIGHISAPVAEAFGTSTTATLRSQVVHAPRGNPYTADDLALVGFRTFTDTTTTFSFTSPNHALADVVTAELAAWGLAPKGLWHNTQQVQENHA